MIKFFVKIIKIRKEGEGYRLKVKNFNKIGPDMKT